MLWGVSYNSRPRLSTKKEHHDGMTIDHDGLLAEARTAAAGAYAPYSRFRVGAALLCSDGAVFRGVNVENRSYGLTNCAERSAIFAAVSAGHRSFAAIAVFSPDSRDPVPPCGACRQVLSEFAHPEMPVLYAGTEGRTETTVGELYPHDSLHELKGHIPPGHTPAS
jgi:cytidine deaminase